MASRRFDGAITTPDEAREPTDQTVLPEPARPRRPVLIEIAAAILIIGALMSFVGTVGYQVGGGDVGPIGVLVLGLNLLTVVVGFLIRGGRAWVLAINVVAIALFLELTALPSGLAFILATLDSIVLFALFRHRGWFDWRPPEPMRPAG